MKVRTGHASLQFGDNDKNTEHDLGTIFSRARKRRWAWITGTEAGTGSHGTGKDLLRIGKQHGYRLWVPSVEADGIASHSDAWIAVREDLIDGGWKEGFDYVIPGSKELYKKRGLSPDLNPRWGPKGLVKLHFHNDLLGDINLGAAHYLHKSRNLGNAATDHGVNRAEWNHKLADAIGAWAEKVAGESTGIAFYGGDQNMADDRKDRSGDTFFGNPMTSAWDELHHWENTGHGTIDVIASYNKDGRVHTISAKAFSDKEFFLHMDHFLIEAMFNIDPASK